MSQPRLVSELSDMFEATGYSDYSGNIPEPRQWISIHGFSLSQGGIPSQQPLVKALGTSSLDESLTLEHTSRSDVVP